MEKNTIWAISLSTVVLVGFFAAQTFLFPNNKNQNVEENSDAQKIETVAEESNSTAADSAESETKNDESNSVVSQAEESVENLKEETYTITTNKVSVTFTNRGGDIISYELIEKDEKGNLKNRDADTGKGVELVKNISEKNRAFALSLGGETRPIINDIFTAKKLSDISIGFFKKYTRIKANFQGLDESGSAYTLRTAPQIGPNFDPKLNRYEYRQLLAYNGEKVKKIQLSQKQTKSYDKPWLWAALAGKYFEFLVYPENNSTMADKIVYNTEIESNNSVNGQLKVIRKATNEKQTTDSYFIYAGPRNESELKKYVSEDKNEWGLNGVHFNESLQTSGFLNWIEIALKFLLEMSYKLVGNWGISIIIVTIILKMALFPITKKSLEGTQKMQKFQPKMKELQDKYRGDPQKLQMETAKMYKEIGYNPMSGCLPLLFQFIILFAMYNLFNNYFEFRGASFIPGWIDDLSVGDHVGPTFETALPFLGWNQIRILPVIYVISQLLFGKITQNGGTAATQNANQMKIMMYGMPIMFFFLFYNAPSGLLLYWTVSNIFQLGQQLVINRMMKNKELTVVKTPSKGKKNKR